MVTPHMCQNVMQINALEVFLKTPFVNIKQIKMRRIVNQYVVSLEHSGK